MRGEIEFEREKISEDCLLMPLDYCTRQLVVLKSAGFVWRKVCLIVATSSKV